MNKFAIGDCVVHRHEGVCKVVKIENADFGDGKTKYYVLKPYFNTQCSTIRIPVEKATQIRPHISKRNAQLLIKKIRRSKTVWINDNRKRKTYFENMIVSGDLTALASVAHTVYMKRNEFAKMKKSLPLTDQNLATFCERLLNEELAIALGIKLEDVPAYIEKHSK
ncbi:MAG: hypothetical protein MJ206_02340 [Bacilli bacterium]|nr:hypothetical protein [Bacilli bacterium]